LKPDLNPAVLTISVARLIAQSGTGLVLFYMSLFAVEQLGLSETLSGVALGLSQVGGILGRIMGGTLVDTLGWGWRRTLLLVAGVAILGDLSFVLAHDFTTFVVANLIMSLSVGFYWPAIETAIADAVPNAQMNEAYAVARLGDSLGLSIGVVLGGAIVAWTQNYRWLYGLELCFFLVFLGLVSQIKRPEPPSIQPQHLGANPATKPAADLAKIQTANPIPNLTTNPTKKSGIAGWLQALGDRRLLLFVVISSLFITIISQVQTTVPLYFRHFLGPKGKVSGGGISALVTWYVVLSALLQLPIARLFRSYRRPLILMASFVCWALGFVALWGLAALGLAQLPLATVAMALFAVALILYAPTASALVVNLAPPAQRGIYVSINALCWSVGYAIGPPLGGWAMDQSKAVAQGFWLVGVGAILGGIILLQILDRWLTPLNYGSAPSPQK
jgi:MFS family permease